TKVRLDVIAHSRPPPSAPPRGQLSPPALDLAHPARRCAAGHLDVAGPPPLVIVRVGLKASGRTRTTAKLARHLHDEQGRTLYPIAGDICRRPRSADFREQLRAVKTMCSVTKLLGMIPGVTMLLMAASPLPWWRPRSVEIPYGSYF